MGIIAWLVFGAIAGWVASMIAGTNERQGCLLNIIVGIVGAFIGGFLYSLLTGRDFVARFDLTSFVVAVIGAVILLFVLTGVRRRR
ncbi:MAG TPA: GlsB/YeaQ/YmgE family stress response membrane protein [Kouleothrix sp.]|uniref:GlsB/YeaQ/YmgE family stress response membrane protein n=1 Tax=Kouleothrix sp. TaxID=2779161 RepID=UPI002CC6D455|nr:GlsB/YeaQ/YmgE family stress response membrane protein [Kouleothrix sp.]HRC75071.1 GlsB/YeaQ/YmgE family stress response membrane protein [Kouleothrix sp.]